MFPYLGGLGPSAPSALRGEACGSGRWLLKQAEAGVEVRGLGLVWGQTEASTSASSSSSSASASVGLSSASPGRRGVRRSLGRRSASSDNAQGLVSPARKPIGPEDMSSLGLELRRLDDWDMDIFRLNWASGGRPVMALGRHIFRRQGLDVAFGLPEETVLGLLRSVEDAYLPNPFHNALHSADVTQAMHCLLLENSVALRLSPLQKLALVLAALGHDLLHPGRNQGFLRKSQHFLASLYSSSVLENFHYHCLLSVLHSSGLLALLSAEDGRQLKRLLQPCVLATDMQQQKTYIDQFQTFLRSPDSPHDRGEASNLQLMQILIKCADINNPCRRWDVSREWSERAVREFFEQGDEERRLGLGPPTPPCDRTATSLAKIQLYFMDEVAAQLFRDWDRFLGSRLSRLMMRNLGENAERWREAVRREEAAAALLCPPLPKAAVFQASRRRVSASAIYAKAARKLSGKWSRRVSLPARPQSSTTWTIRTPLRTIRTQSSELLAPDLPISLQIPPLLAEEPESPSQTGPGASAEWAPSSLAPKVPGARRRFSEPAILEPRDALLLSRAAGPAGGAAAASSSAQRRGSLPVSLPRQRLAFSSASSSPSPHQPSHQPRPVGAF